MQLVTNFPFFSIMLSMACAVICIILKPRAAKVLTFFCLTALSVFSLALLVHTMHSGLSYTFMMGYFPAPFGNELRFSSFEAFMAFLFSILTLLSVAGGQEDLFYEGPGRKINIFYFMINILICAMLATIYTNDIFTAYIFIEITTIAACSLVSARPGGRTLAASISYLILSLIGSSLLLFSIAMLYSVTGHLLFPYLREGVSSLVASGLYATPMFVLTGMMVLGLAVKSALFPFHGWLPDAHASATTSASSILSGLIIKCYPILIIRLVYLVFGLETMRILYLPHIMLLFGILGLVYGSVKAIRQKNVKRMLAYGSVANIGFIFVAMGLNTTAGMVAAAFHIAAHAVGKAMLFTAAGGLAAVSNHHKDFNSLRGSGRRDLFAGAAFALGALSMIGIPLCAGFISKIVVTQAALQTPFAAVVTPLIIVVSTVLSGMYYIPAIVCIFSKSTSEESGQKSHEHMPSQSFTYRTVLGVFMAMTIFLGVFSYPVLAAIERGLAALG